MSHRVDELLAQDGQDARDPRLALGRQAPDRWATHYDRAGTQRERLQDVGAAAHAPVHEDGNPSGHLGHDLGQGGEPGGRSVELAPSVVRDNDAVHAGLNGQLGVLGGEQALHH